MGHQQNNIGSAFRVCRDIGRGVLLLLRLIFIQPQQGGDFLLCVVITPSDNVRQLRRVLDKYCILQNYSRAAKRGGGAGAGHATAQLNEDVFLCVKWYFTK